MKDQIDRQEKTLARLLEWIRAADARIAPLAALNTAMLGILVAAGARVDDWTPSTMIIASAAGLSLSVSVIALAIATFPRTKGPDQSLIYFGGIMGGDYSAYQGAITGLTDEKYLDDLVEQSYRNAEIASVKFRFVRISMILWFVGIATWVPALYLLIQTSN